VFVQPATPQEIYNKTALVIFSTWATINILQLRNLQISCKRLLLFLVEKSTCELTTFLFMIVYRLMHHTHYVLYSSHVVGPWRSMWLNFAQIEKWEVFAFLQSTLLAICRSLLKLLKQWAIYILWYGSFFWLTSLMKYCPFYFRMIS